MFLKLIPLPYRIGATVLLIVSLLGGTYWYGYDKAANKYKTQIEQMVQDKKLLQSQLDAEIANIKVEIVTEYVDRVQVVKEKEYVYRDKIITVPSKCELSTGWVLLHDASATGGNADSTGVTDGNPSGVKDTEALGTVIENYSICQQNAEQLIALQRFVREAQAAVEEANKKAQAAAKKRN